MNLILDISEYNSSNVFFQKPIINTVIDKSHFIRIIYSTNLMMLNGIFLKINFVIKDIENHYNKYKCIFNRYDNITTINKIQTIEREILDRYKTDKIKQYNICEQLSNCFIKLFTENKITNNSKDYILKISGIWVSQTECGITYKFGNINHQ
tara:strand:+ start:1361 stop:1816 length:456 start_codon:yes stop_codon:yes gene_type:complete